MTGSHRRHAARRKNNSAPFFAVAALLIISLTVIFLVPKDYSGVINKQVTIEAGTDSISVEDFIIENKKDYDISLLTQVSDIDLSVPGTYPVEIKCNRSKIKCELKVVDTTAPTAVPLENTVFKGDVLTADKFVKDISDITDVTVQFKNQPDFETAGKKEVTVILKDTSANVTELTALLTVIADVTPPEVAGVENIAVYVGSTVNYRKNVTVTDDYDETPTLKIDSSDVDVSKEGTYTVKYTATDAAGNTVTKTATVTVSRNVNSDDDKKLAAAELADKVLKSIVKDGMTLRQQVSAIYNWARGNIAYSGHSDKVDYLVEAYNTFKYLSGDCYSYFAATKLMFERLGIPNIDVVKVKNSATDSNHYWSLVSIDGGESYYHFDATPRKGTGDDFCLVTDAFLDAYSDAHKKSHNRDKSLYPATPEK